MERQSATSCRMSNTGLIRGLTTVPRILICRFENGSEHGKGFDPLGRFSNSFQPSLQSAASSFQPVQTDLLHKSSSSAARPWLNGMLRLINSPESWSGELRALSRECEVCLKATVSASRATFQTTGQRRQNNCSLARALIFSQASPSGSRIGTSGETPSRRSALKCIQPPPSIGA